VCIGTGVLYAIPLDYRVDEPRNVGVWKIGGIHHLGKFSVVVPQGAEQGKGCQAGFQVIPHRLADQAFCTLIIQDVVNDLESHPHVVTRTAQAFTGAQGNLGFARTGVAGQ